MACFLSNPPSRFIWHPSGNIRGRSRFIRGRNGNVSEVVGASGFLGIFFFANICRLSFLLPRRFSRGSTEYVSQNRNIHPLPHLVFPNVNRSDRWAVDCHQAVEDFGAARADEQGSYMARHTSCVGVRAFDWSGIRVHIQTLSSGVRLRPSWARQAVSIASATAIAASICASKSLSVVSPSGSIF